MMFAPLKRLARRSAPAAKSFLSSSTAELSPAFSSSLLPFLSISEAVRNALHCRHAVVALESTIISHGMPFPQNYECALQVEEAVRNAGAIPATIALMDGVIKVGLSRHEIEVLARTGLDAVKTSRRDLALVLARKAVGSTTVSSTMIAAHMAGIKVFVTGGIGGVHRGAGGADVSADLTELGRTPVAVVCAGVKSILDIERTLEYLETQGVTNVTFGKTRDFPAFYTRLSGFQSMAAMPTSQECAELIHVNQQLGLQSGIVIACPIPKEDEVEGAEQFDSVIQKALDEADSLGIKGKDTTPFLLGKMKELTKGDSLRANIALVMNNAKIGARIARDYAVLQRKQSYSTSSTSSSRSSLNFDIANNGNKRPLIVGGSVLDISAKTDTAPLEKALHTSSPGSVSKSPGGVGRNIAQVCHMAGGTPLFLSSVGSDEAGDQIINHLQVHLGMKETDLFVHRDAEYSTAIYNSFFDCHGELIGAVADMKIQHQSLDISCISSFKEKVSIVAVDGNITGETLQNLVEVCLPHRIPILFEPTSVSKARKLLYLVKEENGSAKHLSSLSFITPDLHELKELAELLQDVNPHIPRPEIFTPHAGELSDIQSYVETLVACVPNVIVKLGKRGVVVATRRGSTRRCNSDGKVQSPIYKFTWIKSTRPLQIVNVSGAGDSLVGVFCAALSKNSEGDLALLPHERLVDYARKGVVAAEHTCESIGISPKITRELLGL